jgi:hypothetical protein
MQMIQARHTPCEELIRRTLFGKGTEQRCGDRVVAISYSELAMLTGRHQRTVERAISGLIRKGAIEVIAKGLAGNPTKYRVVSFSEIARARSGSGGGSGA